MEHHVARELEPLHLGIVGGVARQQAVARGTRRLELDWEAWPLLHHQLWVEEQRVVHQNEMVVGERTIVHHHGLRDAVDGHRLGDHALGVHHCDAYQRALPAFRLPVGRVAKGPELASARAELGVRGLRTCERATPRSLTDRVGHTILAQAHRKGRRALVERKQTRGRMQLDGGVGDGARNAGLQAAVPHAESRQAQKDSQHAHRAHHVAHLCE
mmetsp:Transcript_6057/g.18201  ORF Transcript_6057/g.18201 Transcript_6057/m.18201 type:complete len:214 (+) Transcript_6057:790-1431(+)